MKTSLLRKLKNCVYISLGIHLVSLGLFSFIFRDFRMGPLPDFNIEISFSPLPLSVMAGEKPAAKPLAPVYEKIDPPKEEAREALSRKEAVEPPAPKKEPEQTLPVLQASVVSVADEAPKTLPPKREEEPKEVKQTIEKEPVAPPVKKEAAVRETPPPEIKPIPKPEPAVSPVRPVPVPEPVTPSPKPAPVPQQVHPPVHSSSAPLKVEAPPSPSLSIPVPSSPMPSAPTSHSVSVASAPVSSAPVSSAPVSSASSSLEASVPSFQLREIKEGPSHNVGSHGEPASIITKLPPPPSTEASFFKPNYRENPKPVYPPEARRKGYQGEVILKVEILPSGHTGKIELKKSSGHESLDRSALTAVKQWKFIPATEGEQRVASWVNIPIRFQIQ